MCMHHNDLWWRHQTQRELLEIKNTNILLKVMIEEGWDTHLIIVGDRGCACYYNRSLWWWVHDDSTWQWASCLYLGLKGIAARA